MVMNNYVRLSTARNERVFGARWSNVPSRSRHLSNAIEHDASHKLHLNPAAVEEKCENENQLEIFKISQRRKIEFRKQSNFYQSFLRANFIEYCFRLLFKSETKFDFKSIMARFRI